MKCPQALDIDIQCRGEVAISPEGLSRILEFDIVVKTETSDSWLLTEASIAYQSPTKDLFYEPLSHFGESDEEVVNPGQPLQFHWAKEASEFYEDDPVVMVKAEAENTIGLRCKVDATYPKR